MALNGCPSREGRSNGAPFEPSISLAHQGFNAALGGELELDGWARRSDAPGRAPGGPRPLAHKAWEARREEGATTSRLAPSREPASRASGTSEAAFAARGLRRERIHELERNLDHRLEH